ncbi:MAG: hypothetical protein LQ340_000976 [Diploschistes diacapsis]|nr:MAG: hypothetical protein LQ340_000976 [Diploschistes diacapsis]
MSSSRDSGELQKSPSNRVPGSFPEDDIASKFQVQRNLAREVYDRRDEYTRTLKFKIKVGSWNVAALPGTVRDLGEWFAHGKGISKAQGGIGTKRDEEKKREEHDVEGVVHQEKRQNPRASTVPINDPGDLPKDDEIGIYALGLQEIVDVNSAAEALRPFNDPHPSRIWKEAVSKALPEGYALVAEHQLIGLLLLVYASPDIAKTVSSVSTTHVGTGLMGYMGNKGAVAARIVLGERTKVVFVNSHLAAGSDKASLDRRNWDFGQIMQRTRFAPVDHGNGVVEEIGDEIGDEDFAFWFGDLNYRLGSIPGEDVRRLLMLHTRDEYGTKQASAVHIEKELKIDSDHPESSLKSMASMKIGSGDTEPSTEHEEELDPSEDPTSVQTTVSSLIVHDQLHEQMRLKKAFSEGWREGPIKFLPTYKYDIGSVGMFDSSEKKRAPSWCDRILYRTRKDYVEYLKREKEHDEARRRDQEMKARGLEGSTDEVIFDNDAEADGGDDDYDENNEGDEHVSAGASQDGTVEDRLHIEYYTSHQRVLSSDHKPLDAIFTMEYDAVDPERKTAIHQEVAREIDRAENEGRPAITVIIENHNHARDRGEGCYFGDIRFREEKSITVTLANTSPVLANFCFLAKQGVEATPSWVRLVFHHKALDEKCKHLNMLDFTLQPGDTMNVEVIAQVIHPSDLASFNEGISKPDDILILQVRNGPDHFIPIHAKWLRSCFGVPLDKLVRLPKEGARSKPLPAALDKEDVRWSAPRELFRLTESLEENLSAAIASNNDYSHDQTAKIGWPFSQDANNAAPEQANQHASDLLAIREALDTGSPLDFPSSIPPVTKTELLARTLVLFLSYMPGRLIPDALWFQLSSSLAEHEKTKRPPLAGEDLRSHILDVISASPIRSVSFTFITFMLQRIISQLASPEDQDESKISSPLGPKSPEALLKRARGMSLATDPRSLRRREIEKAYVEVFLPLVFEVGRKAAMSAKARKAEAERKRIVLEIFLRSRDENGM